MKNFFKKEKNWKKEKDSFWLNINFYWKASVCFIFAALFASSFFGYHLFKEMNKEFVSEIESANSQIETIKKERIEKALEYFFLREKKSAEILNFPAPIIDPSL